MRGRLWPGHSGSPRHRGCGRVGGHAGRNCASGRPQWGPTLASPPPPGAWLDIGRRGQHRVYPPPQLRHRGDANRGAGPGVPKIRVPSPEYKCDGQPSSFGALTFRRYLLDRLGERPGLGILSKALHGGASIQISTILSPAVIPESPALLPALLPAAALTLLPVPHLPRHTHTCCG